MSKGQTNYKLYLDKMLAHECIALGNKHLSNIMFNYLSYCKMPEQKMKTYLTLNPGSYLHRQLLDKI